jgi:hypothetical protein
MENIWLEKDLKRDRVRGGKEQRLKWIRRRPGFVEERE